MDKNFGSTIKVCVKDFWSTIKVCVKVLEPAVKVIGYRDGMWGGTLGLMYNLLLQLVHLYSSPIEGLPEKVRSKVNPRCIGVSNAYLHVGVDEDL